MATKSFLKDVVIRDSKLAQGLVNALSESADKAMNGMHKQEIIELSRPNKELKGNEIKSFFGIE